MIERDHADRSLSGATRCWPDRRRRSSSNIAQNLCIAKLLLADRFGTIRDALVGKQPLRQIDLLHYSGLINTVSKVQLVDKLGSEPNIIGSIHVTTSHVIFKAEEGAKEIWIPNGLLGVVEKGALSAIGTPLTIRCKHFLTLTFLISRDKECQELYETLNKCGKPVNITDVFAFESIDRSVVARPGAKKRGWNRFDWKVEFSRQGVGSADDKAWSITNFNEKYQHCDTYPKILCVPSAAETKILLGSCKFRSRDRFPVLTYFHRSNMATITRCAQPLTGFSARCIEDEVLIDLITKTNPNCSTLYLIDTRPRVNAMVNKVQGKGFEDVRNYSNLRFHFFDIDNIHVMRSSLLKLIEACHQTKTVSQYYKQVMACGWLKHVRSILECANFVASSIARGISCVVHCSDGWDRTAQTVSLAELLLDPYYRTIRGFQILIEKDWLGFGHKFDDRCGHVGALNEEAAKEVSPVFTQFLDAVFQLQRQHPRAFEFNERYLIHMNENAHSCEYGTFLGNCDKDRIDLNLATRTKSFWAFVDDRFDDYINPFYEPNKYDYLEKLDLYPSAIVVWNAMYNRYDSGLLPRENATDVTLATLEHVGVLEAHLATLQARLAELKALSGKQTPCSETMADSGHSSSASSGGIISVAQKFAGATVTDKVKSSKGELNDAIQRQDTLESDAFETSFSYGEDVESFWPALHWQSIRSADECANVNCGAEFMTRGERRLHCYRCGKIYCRRCISITCDEHERLCTICSAQTL